MKVEVEKPMKPLLTFMPFKQHGILEIASLMPSKRHNLDFFHTKIKKTFFNARFSCHFGILNDAVSTKYLVCL